MRPVNSGSFLLYIDKNGEVVLQKKCFAGGEFHEGLAWAKLSEDGKVGFIDKKGAVVIDPCFDSARNFCNGLCAVELGGKWGFIDKSGEIVILPCYLKVGEFHDGRIGVQKDQHGPIRYINDKNETVLADNGLPNIYNYSEKLLRARSLSKPKHGFRNIAGDWHIPPRFELAQSFSEGLAAVNITVKRSELTGYITEGGEFAIEPKYETTVSVFQEGLAEVVGKVDGEYRCGCIDKKGELVIPYRFRSIHSFSEGLAAVGCARKKYGFINKAGELVIECQYEGIWAPFRNGLALVHNNYNLFYINTEGKTISQRHVK